MDETQSSAHTTWECKDHIVWIPKYRRKVLYGHLRRHLGGVLRELARQKECAVEERHLLAHHVHVLLSVPPKYAVAQVVGFPKGKSAIHIARSYLGRRQNFTGEHFWARGYYVSTVGRDEAAIREYIRKQEVEDQRPDQLTITGPATRSSLPGTWCQRFSRRGRGPLGLWLRAPSRFLV